MSNKYRDFFIDSPEGQDYMKRLEQKIQANYKQGENTPDLSRDYMQRAKGNREALNLIQTLTTGAKKD